MRVVLSADMEGISQITDLREVIACSREYWDTGRRRMNADVAAAAAGLLAGGATEVIVLDNHASGNPMNVTAEALPPGARLETWNVFDLADHDVEALLQVGYHARCGEPSFISHTYVPRLRLRVADELISESHGRAWAARVPLIGVIGSAAHEQTLGSLAGTPFLAVQESRGRTGAKPLHDGEQASSAAIREFAERALREIGSAPRPAPPSNVSFAASLPDGDAHAPAMTAAGWAQTGPTEFEVRLSEWADAREPLAAAMGAAMSPFMPLFAGLDLTSAEAWAEQDRERLAAMERAFSDWCHESEAPWLGAGGDAAR